MMDTKTVKTFVVLAETLSYQKTSHRLSYAPSTLTTHIYALEQELGVKLFVKVGRQLELTEEGKHFREHALRLLSDYEQAMQSVAKVEQKMALSVGGCELAASYACAALFDSFLKKYPNIRLSTQFTSNAQAPRLIQNGEVDLSIHYPLEGKTPPNLEGIVLYREPVCLVTSANHPLAQGQQVRYKDLAGQTFSAPHEDCYCTTHILQQLVNANVERGDVYYLGGMMQMVIKQLLHQNTFLACPYSAAIHLCAGGKLKTIELAEEPIWLYAGVFYSPAKRTNPAVASFMRSARLFAQEAIRQDPTHFLLP